MSAPLVSCLMVTGDRAIFAARALDYFGRLTYEPRELVIVDGGKRPLPIPVGRFAGASAGVSIQSLRADPSSTLGKRRNMAAAAARGEILMHFDDDDWHAPGRLDVQVNALRNAAMVQTSSFWIYDVRTGLSGLCPWEKNADFAHGTSMAYHRKFWEDLHFGEDRHHGVDELWWKAHREAKVNQLDMLDRNLFVYILHGHNVTRLGTAFCRAKPVEVSRLLGNEFTFYEDMHEVVRTPTRTGMEGVFFRGAR